MKNVNAVVNENDLIVTIPAEYLERQCEQALMTNYPGEVTDRQEMLKRFAYEFTRPEDDSRFGSLIDQFFSDAMENGEDFVVPLDDED